MITVTTNNGTVISIAQPSPVSINVAPIAGLVGPQGPAGADGADGVGGGLQDVVEDTSPQLGGDLDAQSNNITNLGSINGTTATILINGASAGSRALQDVSDDLTPQLGGDLDLNGNEITTSTVNGDLELNPNGSGSVVMGSYTFDVSQSLGVGQDNYVLTYDNTTGKISLEASSGGGGGLSDLVGDTTPQLGGNLDLNNSNITGTGDIDTTGTLTLTNTTTGDSLTIVSTEDSSTAAPVICLKRNSSSPDDGDYLGQIKFQAENDNDQQVLYAKITGKTSDVTDGTEDGLLEVAVKRDGSNVIISRFTHSNLKLINGTGLELDGNITFTSGNTIKSQSNADIDISPNGTGDVLLGNFKFDADQSVSASEDKYLLTYDNSAGKISLKPLFTQVTGKTVNTAGWSLVGGLYQFDISDSNISSSSVVDVIPDNSGFSTVVAAELLPANVSSSNSVRIFANNLPSADFDVTINIFN